MDEILFGKTVSYICLVAGIIGTLIGIDLIFGARVIVVLRRVLDRATDVIDKTLIGTHSNRIIGAIILILSLIILFLVSKSGI